MTDKAKEGKSEVQEGVLGIEYAHGRERDLALTYRLGRRCREVINSIEEFASAPVESILDLGTADGRMLNKIDERFSGARCTGIELNPELIEYGRKLFPNIELIEGDVQKLDFEDNTFDVAVATAVIEHVNNPKAFLIEVKRVLKDSGIVILTAPDPFWEHVATMVGHLEDEDHQHVHSLKTLKAIAREAGFTVLKAEKFMLSPVGMPLEIPVEKIFRTLGLGFLMANQLLVIKKDR